MNLKDLLDKVLSLGSNISINEGKEIYRKKQVFNITSKSINGVYHIYSKVNEDDDKNIYSCHVRFDLKNKKVMGCTCTCNTYDEFSKYKSNYICKHIVASIFSFYSIAKNKIVKLEKSKTNNKVLKNDREKSLLKLEIEIKESTIKSEKSYDIALRIGESFTYLIPSLEDFFKNKECKRPFRINGEFLYNPNLMKFNDEDEKFLKYIEKFKVVQGRFIRIEDNKLREALGLLENSKKIKLSYDYINYEANVIKEDLPISFTIKDERENFVLTSKKKLPIPLSKEFDIFINDRQIYLPSLNQVSTYKYFYDKLQKDEKIIYKKEKAIFMELLSKLKNITNEVFLGEGVQRFYDENLKGKFYFHRKYNSVLCKAVINYFGEDVNILDKENKDIFLRDFKKEEKLIMELERLKFIKRGNLFLFVGEDEDMYDLLASGINSLRKLGKVNFSKEFNTVKLISDSDIDCELNVEEDNIYFNYAIGDFDLRELGDVYNALSENKRFYITKSNNILDLSNIKVRNFLSMLDNLGYDEKGTIEVDKNKALFIEDSLNNNFCFVKGEECIKEVAKNLIDRRNINLEVPKELNATLRNYQITGFNYLKSTTSMGFGGILADEMGLGKTVQTIAFLLSEKEKKTLIITPTSLIYNWKEEFNKFAPTLEVGIAHGSKAARRKVFENKEALDIIITTYGSIKNDFEMYKDEVFDYCIIDEAQNIKNPKSQNTKIIKQLKSNCRIALTGTPIENNLMELWSIFDFIMPGYLFDENKFKEKYMYGGKDKIKELKDLITPFILRRLKKDVILELPDKIEKKYIVPMTNSQRLVYKEYMKEIKVNLQSGKEDKFTILSYLTKLRQLCLDPSLIKDDYIGGSGKLNVAIEMIEEGIKEKNKILVFSQFTSVLKKIKNELNERNITPLYLDGSTSAKERLKLVKEFNEDENINVFLISLKAGGTGLNLTSANVVIHFDPWWNPAIEDQATDRAHRIGQKNIVEVIKLISKDTIEEKIVKLQEDKRAIINDVLNDDIMNTNLISKLSNEEILELFK